MGLSTLAAAPIITLATAPIITLATQFAVQNTVEAIPASRALVGSRTEALGEMEQLAASGATVNEKRFLRHTEVE